MSGADSTATASALTTPVLSASPSSRAPTPILDDDASAPSADGATTTTADASCPAPTTSSATATAPPAASYRLAGLIARLRGVFVAADGAAAGVRFDSVVAPAIDAAAPAVDARRRILRALPHRADLRQALADGSLSAAALFALPESALRTDAEDALRRQRLRDHIAEMDYQKRQGLPRTTMHACPSCGKSDALVLQAREVCSEKWAAAGDQRRVLQCCACELQWAVT